MRATAGTVVLIHGLWMTGLETSLLRARLRDGHGFATERFSYRTVNDGLDDNIAALAAYLRSLPAGRLHLVGHSLGGLLALHTLQRHPDERVQRVVALGTPFLGSAAARAVARWPYGEMILGATVCDGVLAPRLERWDGSQQVGSIAGTLNSGLGTLVETLEKPNDGTITVAETRLPGIADHLELPVSHAGFLVNRDVADQTAHFLRHGAFRRG